MTCENNSSIVSELLELITNQRFDGMTKAVRILINLAMEIKRDDYLGVLSFERSESWRCRRHEYKPKRVKTCLKEWKFSIPQV